MMRAVVLVNINLLTKFEIPSFTHFKDEWGPIIQKWVK